MRLLNEETGEATNSIENISNYIEALLDNQSLMEPSREILQSLIVKTLLKLHSMHMNSDNSECCVVQHLKKMLRNLINRSKLKGMCLEVVKNLQTIAAFVDTDSINQSMTNDGHMQTDSYIPLTVEQENREKHNTFLERKVEKFIKQNDKSGEWEHVNGWMLW